MSSVYSERRAMARYAVSTELTPAEVIERAVRYFHGELGLELAERTECCARFSGGGGHVSVTVAQEQGEAAAEIETREWDYQVREFMRRIG